MNDFLVTESNNIVLSEFYEGHIANKYNYEAEYQRNLVWNLDKRRFLIDSIFKNFPIPPIFLRMYIDEDTGTTKYDVIDGKQRLSTIIEFIEGKISLPDDFGSGVLGNDELNGVSFKDLERYPEYKKRFWRYKIPIIYIDIKDNLVIKEIFDRLNRNGEPLTYQELRHAKYHKENFYILVEKMAELEFWKKRLENLEINRMEDKEFISELLFLMLEKNVIAYTKRDLDDLYDKWIPQIINIQPYRDEFMNITKYMEALDLDYDKYKIEGVSHLYGIWGLCFNCYNSDADLSAIKDILNKFYMQVRVKDSNEMVQEYIRSMSSGTKGRSSRVRRIKAMTSYLIQNGINVENVF
ncbi:MAG: hypothetical protein RHS_4822 [Robinsoniella sp. RHS]|uniref:GmrSD restriction endonuclease domain-containing protein n=1 Tax=Robinsoniella sp. RHS TaxID=1504536 RepID=UPI00064AC2F6|nr:MAG: hypothetical protein RHS_4822 [Robinsoniella sp. RHS]